MVQSETKKKDWSLFKQISLAVIVFLFFLIFWFVLYRLFYGAPAAEGLSISIFSRALHLLLLLSGMTVIGMLIGLVGILVRRLTMLITYLCSAAFFLIFFPARLISVLALIVLLLLLFWGYYLMHGEVRGRRQINLYKILKYGVPAALTGLSIVTAVVYYLAASEKINQQGLQISDNALASMVGPLENFIAQNYLPGFKKEMTINDITYLLLLEQLRKEQLAGEKMDLPPDLLKILQEENIDVYNQPEIFLALEQNPHVKSRYQALISDHPEKIELDSLINFQEFGLSGETLVVDALEKVINQKLNEAVGPYQKYLVAILAVSFYLSLQFFSIFNAWIIYGIAWIIFKILVAVKLVQIVKEQQAVESIKL